MAARRLLAAAAAVLAVTAADVQEEDFVFRTQTNWQTLDNGGVLRPYFDRYVRVFGVYIFASERVEPWALQHAARVMAKFFDQDEDGVADEPEVVEAMVERKAMQALLFDEDEWEEGIGILANDPDLSSGVIKNDLPTWNCDLDEEVWVLAELFQSEMPASGASDEPWAPPYTEGPPYGREDASWEEIIHLISHVGLGCADPERWSFLDSGSLGLPFSTVAQNLNAMTGPCGYAFNGTQTPPQPGCHYYYDDETCFYPCLINEYLWFSCATFVGGLDYACGSGIEREWEFCTQALMEPGDTGGWANLGDRTPPPMPLIFGSGHYRPPVVPDYDFEVQFDVPAELSEWFDRYVLVFGVYVFTSSTVDDWAMQHIARVLAKFLDQDEDGTADEPRVVAAMVARKAMMCLLANEDEYEDGIGEIADGFSLEFGVIKNDRPVWTCDSPEDVWVLAEVWQAELVPPCEPDCDPPFAYQPDAPPYGRWDVAWEEVYHLVSHLGYGCGDPSRWSTIENSGSVISDNLNTMIGSCGFRFNDTQTPRQPDCHYYYSDPSCFYSCQVNEYLYQAYTTQLGASEYKCRPNPSQGYDLCTQPLMFEGDRICWDLLADAPAGAPPMPQILPSGHYRPQDDHLIKVDARWSGATKPPPARANTPPPPPSQPKL